MHQVESFEWSSPRVVAIKLKAGSVIRVTSGRLWLTQQGQTDDVWLQTGATWTVPVNATLWLSAEPVTQFQLLQAWASPSHTGVPAQTLAWFKRGMGWFGKFSWTAYCRPRSPTYFRST